MRRWILLTVLATKGLGSVLALTESDALLQELSALRRKSAEDDARITNLESRLAAARTFGAQSGQHGATIDTLVPLPLPSPSGVASTAAANDAVISAHGGARQRSILQADAGSDSPACSKEELRRVADSLVQGGASQAIVTFLEIMSENAACGGCMMACVTAPDIVYCLYSCMHQRENQCGNATRDQLAPLVSGARLDDRASIVAMFEVGADCAYACSAHRVPLQSMRSALLAPCCAWDG